MLVATQLGVFPNYPSAVNPQINMFVCLFNTESLKSFFLGGYTLDCFLAGCSDFLEVVWQ